MDRGRRSYTTIFSDIATGAVASLCRHPCTNRSGFEGLIVANEELGVSTRRNDVLGSSEKAAVGFHLF